MEGELTAVKTSASGLRVQLKTLGDEFSGYRSDSQQRERELRRYVEQLERRENVIQNLMQLLIQRAEFLQADIERLAHENQLLPIVEN